MELLVLQQHDDRWLAAFRSEQELIFKILGIEVNKIHHVGSTVVPDLLAKPVIDIAIESGLFPPTQTIIDKLAASGYECRGEAGVKGRFWFIKGQPRKFNLHFCPINSDVVKNQIEFRNKLIGHAPFRREYEDLKLKNCQGKDIDSANYAHAKSDFIYKVLYYDMSR